MAPLFFTVLGTRMRGCDNHGAKLIIRKIGIPPRAWVRHYLLWSISHSIHCVVGFLRSSRGGAALLELKIGAACPYRLDGEISDIDRRVDVAVEVGRTLRADPCPHRQR